MSEQPAPVPNDLPAVWDLVIEDMRQRDALGLSRYGTRLQPHNGRDALRDLAEELYDAVVYLKQFRIEMRCLGQDVVRLRALLATLPCPESADLAEAVSLVECILRRNPALTAE
jgi:hypothetical protein